MLLFVCTGNTCRSPLAAALARRMGIDAQSAGLSPLPGAPATIQAQRTAAALGADLSAHRAQAVSPDLLAGADRIYAMTQAHADALRSRFPAFAERIFTLHPQIPDPYGGDDQVYAQCAQLLLKALAHEGLTSKQR